MNDEALFKKYPVKGKDVIYKEIESKSVLLNLGNGQYYTLNKTGTFLWSLIDGKTPIKNLVEQVTKNFEVASETASEDVDALISSLQKEDLIELHDKPAQP